MSFTHYDEMLFSNFGGKKPNKHQNCSQRDSRDKTRHMLFKNCLFVLLIMLFFGEKNLIKCPFLRKRRNH